MFTLAHFEAHQQHLLDLQKEAEEERLLRIDRINHTEQRHVLAYATGWLGGQLIEWGECLQRRSAYFVTAHQ